MSCTTADGYAKPSFANSWEFKELLAISQSHLLEATKSGRAIGVHYVQNLMVSTVFAATAIEAALNDFLWSHCLFLHNTYLHGFFGAVMEQQRMSVPAKIKLLKNSWTEEFPAELLEDISKLFKIRNRIVHAAPEFSFDDLGKAKLTKRGLPLEYTSHMLRHHDIAKDFLSRFWLPGNAQLESKKKPTTSKTRKRRKSLDSQDQPRDNAAR